jgi:hypothetical protein
MENLGSGVGCSECGLEGMSSFGVGDVVKVERLNVCVAAERLKEWRGWGTRKLRIS